MKKKSVISNARFQFFLATLFLFLGLGSALHWSHGHYHESGLLLMTVTGLFFLIRGLIRGVDDQNPDFDASNWLRIGLWTSLSYFLLVLHGDSLLIYPKSSEDFETLILLVQLAAGLGIVGFFLNLRSEFRWSQWLLLAIGFLLFSSRVFVLWASPEPLIDVFTMGTEASRYLLSGILPYGQPYQDIYNGYYRTAALYGYWPGVLLPETFFYFLFGDIRFTFIFCDLFTLVGIYLIGRRFLRGQPSIRWLLPVLWLSFPASLFVLEQAWNENLIVMVSIWFLYFLLEKKWFQAAVMMGLGATIKQYMVFWLVLSVLLLFKCRGQGARMMRSAVVGLSAFFFVMLPFVFWDWRAFYSSTFQTYLNSSIRSDALSLIAAAQRRFSFDFPGYLMSLIDLAFFGVAAFYLVCGRSGRLGFKEPLDHSLGWSFGLVIVYGAVFLFGKQAFCNYYFLCGFFIFIHLVLVTGSLLEGSAEGSQRSGI